MIQAIDPTLHLTPLQEAPESGKTSPLVEVRVHTTNDSEQVRTVGGKWEWAVNDANPVTSSEMA